MQYANSLDWSDSTIVDAYKDGLDKSQTYISCTGEHLHVSDLEC